MFGILGKNKDLDRFFRNPIGTMTEEIVKNSAKKGSDVIGKAAISGYLDFLRMQALPRWKKLPDYLIEILESERHYSHINLHEVRYAECVDTVHGMGITIDKEIFFPCDIDFFNNKDHLEWMLHELEHVTQYTVRGGVASFLVQYGLNAAVEALKQGSLNIHDNIAMEKEATDKANRIIDEVWYAVHSAPRPGHP